MIIKGNHDSWIEKIIETADLRSEIKIKKYFSVNNFYLTHGHRKANTKKKTIIIGHNHPFIKFTDEFGSVYYEPVWLKGLIKIASQRKELIIMPAFNELSGMTVTNEHKILGPIARLLNKRRTHVFMLDGTDLGTLFEIGK